MTNDTFQKQQGGDSSINQQAGRDLYNYLNEYKEDIGIIEEIFEHIINNKKTILENINPENTDGFVELDEKISINFTDESTKIIEEKFHKAKLVHKKTLVGDFIKLSAETRSDEVEYLLDQIQNYYREVRKVLDISTPIKEYMVLYDMSKKILPASKVKNPIYLNNAFAIIYYYFEMCFFGKK